jgi:hypothetical protein
MLPIQSPAETTIYKNGDTLGMMDRATGATLAPQLDLPAQHAPQVTAFFMLAFLFAVCAPHIISLLCWTQD